MYLAGLGKNKPVPREPLVFKKSRANISALLG